MKYVRSLLLAVMATAFAAAAPLLTLQPAELMANPGTTAGWGFTLSPDPDAWVSVTGVVVLAETNPLLGTFTDFISPQGGPILGVLQPGTTPWTQNYNEAMGEGFGGYAIDPNAIPGDSNSGTFLVLYEVFSADPNFCGSCLVGRAELLADFKVTATPEPSSLLLTGAAMLAGAWWLRRKGGGGESVLTDDPRSGS